VDPKAENLRGGGWQLVDGPDGRRKKDKGKEKKRKIWSRQ
jgi:hypothetical protein